MVEPDQVNKRAVSVRLLVGVGRQRRRVRRVEHRNYSIREITQFEV